MHCHIRPPAVVSDRPIPPTERVGGELEPAVVGRLGNNRPPRGKCGNARPDPVPAPRGYIFMPPMFMPSMPAPSVIIMPIMPNCM